jgi:hypothetical protein
LAPQQTPKPGPARFRNGARVTSGIRAGAITGTGDAATITFVDPVTVDSTTTVDSVTVADSTTTVAPVTAVDSTTTVGPVTTVVPATTVGPVVSTVDPVDTGDHGGPGHH